MANQPKIIQIAITDFDEDAYAEIIGLDENGNTYERVTVSGEAYWAMLIPNDKDRKES